MAFGKITCILGNEKFRQRIIIQGEKQNSYSLESVCCEKLQLQIVTV